MSRCTHCAHRFGDEDAIIKRLEPVGIVKTRNWKTATYKVFVECPNCKTETRLEGVLSV